MGAPPCIHESPLQVSLPGSPGPGTVLNRQTSLPVFASIAIIIASNAARNSLSPRIARPRVRLPQQFFAAGSGLWEYDQILAPVAALSAITSFGLWIVYMIPLTTNGVTSCFSRERDWKTHFNSRSFTFAGVI